MLFRSTIVDAFHTQTVAEFLLEAYKEAYFPAFDYDADYTVDYNFVNDILNYKSSSDGKTVVKVGVCGSSNDHWLAVQKVLDDENAGIYIELVTFDAYNLPNEALNNGDIDLNSFQHKAYLSSDAEANNYDLTVIGDTLIAQIGRASCRERV